MIRLLSIPVLLCLLLVPALAFAQVAPVPAAPTLSTGVMVVMILSILTGACVQAVQSGKVLGQIVLPPVAVTILTIVAPFLAGTVTYLQSVAWSGSAVFFAVCAGLTNMIGASASGIAVHANFVVPSKMARIRAMRAAGTLITCFALFAMSGCAWLKSNGGVVATDITSIGFCELNYIATAATPTPEGAVQACIGLAITDATNTFNTLENAPAGSGVQSALGAKIHAARGAR